MRKWKGIVRSVLTILLALMLCINTMAPVLPEVKAAELTEVLAEGSETEVPEQEDGEATPTPEQEDSQEESQEENGQMPSEDSGQELLPGEEVGAEPSATPEASPVPDVEKNNGGKEEIVGLFGEKNMVAAAATYQLKSEILEDGTVSITGYTGTASGELVIPEEIGGVAVTKIGDEAFRYCRGFTGDLVIPGSVTEIGRGAFQGYGSNGNLVISEGVTEIGDSAFYGCIGFTGNLVIPGSVTKIGKYAFHDCSRFTGDLVIPESVTEIGDSAFRECRGFTGNLVIPEGVTEIGRQAFLSCSGFTGNLVIPGSVTEIGERAFSGCTGFTGNLVISGNETQIGDGAFSGCSGFMGDLTISGNGTQIGDSAFWGCSGFTGNLVISEGVTKIGDWAFWGCSGFTGNLVIPGSVTEIGRSAFDGCSGFTGNLVISEGVTEIGGGAFGGCSGFTGDLVIPEGVTEIGEYTFGKCSGFTGNLVIPEGVTEIGRQAFLSCSGLMGNLAIPGSVTQIGVATFSGCSGFTGDLVIPGSVTEIGEGAFGGCSGFTGDLVISESVTKIGDSAFWGCSSLTGDLVIPGSVTEIGRSAFYGCSGFTGMVTIPSSISRIEALTFFNCIGLEEVVIPKTITYIDVIAFSRSNGESKITIVCEKNSYAENWAKTNGYPVRIVGAIVSTVRVNFDTQGGNLIEPITEIKSGSKIDLPNPVREGYIFMGWYTAPEEGVRVITPLKVDTNTTLYAHWKAEEDMEDVWVQTIAPQSYTGVAIKPVPQVYNGTQPLVEGKDYTVSYKNNINVAYDSKGTVTAGAQVIIKGKGDFSDTQTMTFTILPQDIDEEAISVQEITLAFNNKVQKPIPVVSFDSKKLANKKDFTVDYPDAGDYKAADTYHITLTGIKNFTGTRTISYTIIKSDQKLMSKMKVTSIAKQPYTGTAITPDVVIRDGSKTLTAGTDYTLTYSNNTEIGTATVTITGMGDYAGSRQVTFSITGKSIAKLSFDYLKTDTYTGGNIEPDITVKDGDITLVKDESYQIAYKNNIKAGKASIIITGKGGYSGTVTKTFTIGKYSLTGSEAEGLVVTTAPGTVPYSKGGSKPIPAITYKGQPLTVGTDFTIKYKNNTAVNDGSKQNKVPTLTISGKGSFTGSLSITFTIAQKPLDAQDSVAMTAPDIAYKNKKNTYQTKPVLVDEDGKTLKVGTDYEKELKYTYGDGTAIGADEIPAQGRTIKVTVTGKNNYSGELSIQYRVVGTLISKASVKTIQKSYIYSGTPITLTGENLTVKIGQTILVEGTDYEIIPDSYQKNVNKGTAKVTIRGINEYGGTKQVSFKIDTKKVKWF